MSATRGDSPAAKIAVGVVGLLVGGGIIAFGWFREDADRFVKLRGWDAGAPTRVVTQFLEAGKAGDQARAESLFDSEFHKPLMKDGKFAGYVLSGRGMHREHPFSVLAPTGPIKPVESKIFYEGDGYARVGVPDSKGVPVYYRLEMRDGAWKITYID